MQHKGKLSCGVCSALLVGWSTCGALANGGPLVDAMGDARDTFGEGGPLLDIDTFDITHDATNLYYHVSFHTPIAPADANLPQSVFGFLEFDIDSDSMTGAQPQQQSVAPPFAELDAGIDFILSLPSVFEGTVFLTTSSMMVVDSFPISFDESAFFGSIPLSAFGDDLSQVRYTGIFGTDAQPTDATDAVGFSHFVPAPGSAALVFLGAFGIRRRRPHTDASIHVREHTHR